MSLKVYYLWVKLAEVMDSSPKFKTVFIKLNLTQTLDNILYIHEIQDRKTDWDRTVV